MIRNLIQTAQRPPGRPRAASFLVLVLVVVAALLAAHSGAIAQEPLEPAILPDANNGLPLFAESLR